MVLTPYVDVDCLVEIAEKAGAVIMNSYQQTDRVSYNNNLSPITQADIDADLIIHTELKKHYPFYSVWSEESQARPPDGTCSFFLVDPLDGTKEFINQNGEFTVNIAWVDQGRVLASVVLAPALNECFKADHRGSFWRQGGGNWRSIECRPAPLTTELLQIIDSRSHAHEGLTHWLTLLNRPYQLFVTGSSLKFCRVAQGLADVYPRFGITCQWDTAAGQGIVEGAGGEVIDFNGQPIQYGVFRDTLNPKFICKSKKLALPIR